MDSDLRLMADTLHQEYFGISKAPSAVVYRNGKELKKTEGMEPQVMKEIMEMLQSTN